MEIKYKKLMSSKYQIHNLLPDGYGRLVQYINGDFYDGFGKLIKVGQKLSELKDVDISGLQNGDVIRWNDVTGFWEPFDILTIGTYSISDSQNYLVLDQNNQIAVSSNPVKISFDFSFGELSYLYISPDRFKIISITSSTNLLANITLNGSPYTFGNDIEIFDNLLIQVNSNGLLIIEGYKLW